MASSSAAVGNIVADWLRSLHLVQYAESFIDNGYDDLEICKQVGEPDLDAIGVLNPTHRQRLLTSIRVLREEGAAGVYFTLEDTPPNLCRCEAEVSPRVKDIVVPSCSTDTPTFVDEYEEGKAELVRIPRVQLKRLLKERLAQDNIRLSLQPYSTTDGDRGYLEGLASRYADQLSTHYGDVLETLEEVRKMEWEEMSPRMRVLPPANLTTSLSQPIYTPGKYSTSHPPPSTNVLFTPAFQPSSCLSNKEEDDIYGFGYGVYGKQMLQRQHQQRQLLLQMQNSPTSTQPLIHDHHQNNYQSCLSPRSAYFYEFPPSENCSNTNKKKGTTFSRLIKGLKTHRKEKHNGASPRNGRTLRTHESAREEASSCSALDAQDYARMAGLRLHDLPAHTMHRLRLEEIKMTHLDSKKEEIFQDLRHGVRSLRRDGSRGPLGGDETYMFDDDARMMGRGHWYDEPPYESDPEDFLMHTRAQQQQPITAAYHNGRVCFTLNLKDEPRRQGVISLRSAGDISVPPRQTSSHLPIHPYQESDYQQSQYPTSDYAPSDLQSLSSRRSTDSAPHKAATTPDSSDFEDKEEIEMDSRCIATVHKSADDCEEISNLVGKVRGLRQDVRRKISRLRHEQVTDSNGTERIFPCTNSSFESLPSGSGSSTQALVRAGSNHSSISVDENPDQQRPNYHNIQYKEVERVVRECGGSVEEMLRRLGLSQYTSGLARHGYLQPDMFRELEPRDLDYLGVTRPEHRARLLAAVTIHHEVKTETGVRRRLKANPSNTCSQSTAINRAVEACSEKSSDSGVSSSSLSSAPRRLDANS